VSSEAAGILHGACMDCHSNETKWRWYSGVAPFSWMIGSDVNAARGVMNFSEWPTDPGEAVANLTAACADLEALTAACADLEAGRMPPAGYRLMHPEARIEPGAAKAFCGWARSRVSAILSDGRTKSE
jgi:hypothetical protein